MGSVSTVRYVGLKRSIYREYSRSYDEDREQFVSAEALASRIQWALESLSPGQCLLDLGCGSGQLLLDASTRTGGNAVLVGLDLSLDMLALARSRVGPRVGLVEGNVLEGLPFQDRNFDLVTSLNLVQELPSPAIAPLLGQVHRVLRPEGTFKAVIPCLIENNSSSLAFRELALRWGAMDFLFGEDLERLLGDAPYFAHTEMHIVPSPAASAAGRGKTRFKFFTKLLKEVRKRGLDPDQVRQGVLFFTARRNFENLAG